MSKLSEGLEELTRQVEHLDSVSEAITNRIFGATDKIPKLLAGIEDGGKWEKELDATLELEKDMALREEVRYQFITRTGDLKKAFQGKEAELRLEIEMESDEKGKKLYSNDTQRKGALALLMSKDDEVQNLESQIAKLDLDTLRFDIGTKRMEAEIHAKRQYVRMIEARLRAISALT